VTSLPSLRTKGLLARSRVQHDDHVRLPSARTDRRRYFAENPGRRTVWFSRFDTTAVATSYRCQSTSSYQVTCTACSPATVSITASVSALAGRPG
jgi:hypothetical protein